MRRLLLLSVIWLLAAQERAVFNSYPSWSPDGEWVAYHMKRDGNWDVWAVLSPRAFRSGWAVRALRWFLLP